jgi:hypothetical protein
MDFNNNQGSSVPGFAGLLMRSNIVQSESAANAVLIVFIIIGFCFTGYIMYTHLF